MGARDVSGCITMPPRIFSRTLTFDLPKDPSPLGAWHRRAPTTPVISAPPRSLGAEYSFFFRSAERLPDIVPVRGGGLKPPSGISAPSGADNTYFGHAGYIKYKEPPEQIPPLPTPGHSFCCLLLTAPRSSIPPGCLFCNKQPPRSFLPS